VNSGIKLERVPKQGEPGNGVGGDAGEDVFQPSEGIDSSRALYQGTSDGATECARESRCRSPRRTPLCYRPRRRSPVWINCRSAATARRLNWPASSAAAAHGRSKQTALITKVLHAETAQVEVRKCLRALQRRRGVPSSPAKENFWAHDLDHRRSRFFRCHSEAFFHASRRARCSLSAVPSIGPRSGLTMCRVP
jgi:hypothetical protein